jgi:hypothetical protein
VPALDGADVGWSDAAGITVSTGCGVDVMGARRRVNGGQRGGNGG